MKKYLLTILVSLFIQSIATAQIYQWAFSFGAASVDDMTDLKIDSAGNVYVGGNLSASTDMDPSQGVAMVYGDSFIAKYDAFGNLVFAYSFDGGRVTDIDLDQDGDIYLSGEIIGFSIDLDFTNATHYVRRVGFRKSPFLAKFTNAAVLIRAISYGGDDDAFVSGIAVDSSEQVYITGVFGGTLDVDPDSIGTLNLSTLTGYDIYLAAYDSTFQIRWAHSFEGNSTGTVTDVVIDTNSNCYIYGGGTSNVDFDPSASVAQTNYGGFVSAYDPFGNFLLLWPFQQVREVTPAVNGDIYISSSFIGTFDYDQSGAVQSLFTTTNRTVIARYSFSGAPVFLNMLGNSSAFPIASSLAVDPAGNCFVVGHFALTIDFDPSAAVYDLTFSPGGQDVFTAMYNATGDFIYAVPFFGGGSEIARTIACDAIGNVVLGGYFSNTIDADPDTVAVVSLASNGSQDCFIGRYNNQNPLLIYSQSVDNEISAYPNPATTSLTLKLSDLHSNPVFSCNTISGCIVQLMCEKTGVGSYEFDTAQLPPGMYFLTISDAKKSRTIKFIR